MSGPQVRQGRNWGILNSLAQAHSLEKFLETPSALQWEPPSFAPTAEVGCESRVAWSAAARPCGEQKATVCSAAPFLTLSCQLGRQLGGAAAEAGSETLSSRHCLGQLRHRRTSGWSLPHSVSHFI